jgi:hypothetical protein
MRTSTDRTGCTNFFREKCTFYGQGRTIGSMSTKPRTLRPPSRAVLCVAPEYPAWELWCFCFLPEYTENFAERAKKAAELQRKKKNALAGCRIATARAEKEPYIEQNGRAYYNEEKAQKGGPTSWHRNICPHRPTSVLRT